MISSPLSATLGLLFLLMGGAAIWLILDSSRRAQEPTARDRRIRAHRVAGYLFILLFCTMTWVMILRAREMPRDLPPNSQLHILIAMVLVPLLFVKVLIARYYKSYASALPALGVTIFTLGFVLIASTAGPYFFRKVTMKDISLEALNLGAAKIDMQSAESLMQKRCSRCHTLDRVLGARKDAKEWLETINRMRALPSSDISEPDAKTILSYLLSEASIDSSTRQGQLLVGKALVDSHCNRCHNLDRTYGASKSPDEWQATVTRMVKYASGVEGFFKPGEPERIIRFLSLTQTRAAVETRANASPAPADDRTGASGASRPQTIQAASWLPTFGVIGFIAALVTALWWKRPQPRSRPAPSSSPAAESPAPPASSRTSLLLQLVRIERQTHDCVTLRFRSADPAALHAKPGQFMTFDWLLDGQKLVRSYSISSSPAQTGYLEITVKKQAEGRVSSFLNERAAVGLTVQARGPAGRFCFDHIRHRRIVLFAGGSGITPIMAMLRYIDDLCLDTDIFLFYSVRTQHDIIFQSELERVERRLPGFRYLILLTKPPDDWKGPAGRISPQLIRETLRDNYDGAFFLCGPDAFMAHVKAILLELGVSAENIYREQFGGKPAAKVEGAPAAAPTGTVEFAKSGKTIDLPAHRTLLEVAELNGVDIPYSCRQGQCGTCATRLLAGDVHMDCEDGLNPDSKAQGFVLTCVGRARGDVRLDA